MWFQKGLLNEYRRMFAMKKLKIMIVTPTLTNGGAERVAAQLARGFVMRGNDVVVVTKTVARQSYIMDEEFKLYNLFPETNNKLQKFWGSVRLLRNYIKKETPDIVIGVMFYAAHTSLLASIGTKVPVIMCEHNPFQRINTEPTPIIDILDHFVLDKFYPKVTVLTQADYDFIHRWLPQAVVMPNPCPFPVWKDVPKKEKIILAAGRMNNWHYKGFDVLIKTWKLVAPKYPEWKLLLAGTGAPKDIEFLKNLARQEKVIDRMEFLGFCDNMQELYQRSEVFLLSSRSEGLPMVVIEAMSQGCACVATDFKGRTKEIITNESEGLLCEPENVEALAANLDYMLSHDEYRHNVQKNAIERSKFYSTDNIIDKWENVFGEMNIL